MEFLIEPVGNGSWVAIKPESEAGLTEKIMSSDILISDIDGTDARSPAIDIVLRALTRRDYLSQHEFLAWVATTAYKLLRKGKDAYTETWLDFVEKFLRNPEELEKIKKKYTPEFIASTFYPGVLEFYRLLAKNIIKVYSTRNIKEIVDAYKEAAKFHEALPEQFDKVRALEDICNRYPNLRRLIIKEDYRGGEGVLEFLNYMARKGAIDYFVSIYVASSPKDINPKSDITIGRDYTGLVNLLKGR